MLSIGVCDDELLERLQISAKIEDIMKELQIPCIIAQFCSGKELLKALGQLDLIFLDILMDEMDGMETARRCRDHSYEKTLIFLSSSRRYVYDAYDVEAFHYLVKPVEDEKLRDVLRRAAKKEQRNVQEYMVITGGRETRKLFLDHIRYFEIRGRQVDVHGEEGIFTYYEKIRTLEEQLKGKGFFRCHKSYLLNLRYVESYDRQEAILDNGERIIIARRRYEDFCQAFLAYVRGNGGMI